MQQLPGLLRGVGPEGTSVAAKRAAGKGSQSCLHCATAHYHPQYRAVGARGLPKSQSISPPRGDGGWYIAAGITAAILLFLIVWFVGVWVVQAIWG
jgi:hypothetical protein